jgi:hypothetical protein
LHRLRFLRISVQWDQSSQIIEQLTFFGAELMGPRGERPLFA